MDRAYERYQAKMNLRGRNSYERNLRHKTYEFEKYFENTLNKESVLVNEKDEMYIAFQDHSQSNNKDLSDDKYIIAPNSTPVNVGDYVRWRESMWMIFSKEYKTIPTHQQAKVKASNQSIKWIRDGKIVNNGIGWWAYVQSQTLYTMGVAERTYIDVVDSKMMMYMQNNAETRDLRMNERIFIGNRVYKIKFTDTVSRKGLISYLLDEDRIHPEYDNPELGVADYYKYFNKDLDATTDIDSDVNIIFPEERVEEKHEISGDEKPRIGRVYEYTSNFEVTEWSIETMEDTPLYVIRDKDDEKIIIEFIDNPRNIGKELTIIAKDNDENYTTLHLHLIRKY